MGWVVRTSRNTQIWMADLVIDNGRMSLQKGGSRAPAATRSDDGA